MNRYGKSFRMLLVVVCSLISAAVMTGSAAANTDVYLGVSFHPFTLDGGNETCVAYSDSHIGQTKNCDPVNLAFPGRTWMEVRDLLLNDGWSLSGGGSNQWLHYDGAQLYVENEQLFKPGTLFGPRYHIRLWQAPGNPLVTFAAVHHEDFFHNIDMDWEQAEADVASALCDPNCEQTGPLGEQIGIQIAEGDAGTWRTNGNGTIHWINDGSATVIPAPGLPNDPPWASFSFSCNGLNCDFDASTSFDPDGTIAGYDWEFGDLNSGSGETTSHSYAAAGTYNVTLTVTDNEGGTGTDNQNVAVVDNPATTAHVGDLQGVSVNVKRNWRADVTIVVHDGGEGSVSGAMVNGFWSGDASGAGNCTTDSNGACTVSSAEMSKKTTQQAIFTVTHIEHTLSYEAADNHDPQGDSSGTAIQVNRDGTSQDPGQPPEQPPVSSFSYDCPDLTCTFDAAGSYDPDGGNIVNYAWDFGDGNGANGLTASHTFVAGTHQVTLTVTDDEGSTADDVQAVSVGQAGGLTLTAAGYKVKGVHHVDLTWSGATSSQVDIYRDGGLEATVDSGSVPYTDNTGQKGGGSYLYQICEEGSALCSEVVTVTF